MPELLVPRSDQAHPGMAVAQSHRENDKAASARRTACRQASRRSAATT
jgi:hypothetical protein